MPLVRRRKRKERLVFNVRCPRPFMLSNKLECIRIQSVENEVSAFKAFLTKQRKSLDIV